MDSGIWSMEGCFNADCLGIKVLINHKPVPFHPITVSYLIMSLFPPIKDARHYQLTQLFNDKDTTSHENNDSPVTQV